MWLGAAVGTDLQRFAADATPNRLDGQAVGWTVLGGLLLPKHLVVTGEWSDAGTIEDVRTTTLSLDGRSIAVTSTFLHRTRGLAVLAGYGHSISRLRLAYLAGVALTDVRREFSSNAPALVLVAPSDRQTPAAVVVRDRFPSVVFGVDVLVRLTAHMALAGGVRFQRLTLDPDLSGRSTRPFAGAGWVF